MNIKSLLFLLFLSVLLMPACTKPSVMLDAVFVLNDTDGIFTEVTVLHEPTKKFGAVNAILPRKVLSG